MARLRKNETSAEMSSAAAAPARRRTASVTRKRPAARPEAAGELEQAEPASEATGYPPSHEEIAALAYSYWLERGCLGGSADEDWLRAEAELRQRVVIGA